MAKPGRKPNSTRKPPEPSESPAEVDDWKRKRVLPDIQPLVEHIDAAIREALPDIRYGVKWKNAYYGTPEVGWVIELAAYDVSMNVVFHGGADLDPPPPLGDTDRSRYVKLRTLEDAQAPELQEWIAQAAKVPGWAWE